MIVTMHQPEHLPWLGFFHKMAQADLFVVMDGVQFRRQYFQNRNRIIGVHAPIWVTVPVRKEAHRHGPIAGVRIDESRAWRRAYWGSIAYHYRKHPHFDRYAPGLAAILEARHATIADLNLALIGFFREALGITTPMIRASRLASAGRKTELIHAIAREVGATTYLSGPTGPAYLDEAPFRRDGIAVRYHAFKHPTYPQRGRDAFVPQLAALDLLMNVGPEARRVLLGEPATLNVHFQNLNERLIC